MSSKVKYDIAIISKFQTELDKGICLCKHTLKRLAADREFADSEVGRLTTLMNGIDGDDDLLKKANAKLLEWMHYRAQADAVLAHPCAA